MVTFKYKKGDKVRVDSYENLLKKGRPMKGGYINFDNASYNFNVYMKDFCGEVVTISGTFESACSQPTYFIEEFGCSWLEIFFEDRFKRPLFELKNLNIEISN